MAENATSLDPGITVVMSELNVEILAAVHLHIDDDIVWFEARLERNGDVEFCCVGTDADLPAVMLIGVMLRMRMMMMIGGMIMTMMRCCCAIR